MKVLPFGQEKFNIVSPSKMQELKEKHHDVFQLAYAIFREIYFNEDAKYNRNVLFVKTDPSIMKVWDGNSWRTFPNEDVIHDMFVTFEKVKALHEDTDKDTLRAILLMERRIKF